MDNFLIPANSKKSLLKFGIFNNVDLGIFLGGVGLSIILLMALPVENLVFAIIALSPGAICALLVLPIPNYHNVRTIIRLAYEFYTTRQQFIWKGWLFEDDEESEK